MVKSEPNEVTDETRIPQASQPEKWDRITTPININLLRQPFLIVNVKLKIIA